MTLKIFYNAKCSKARAALRLLEEAGHEPEVVAYLDQPPSAAELKQLLATLGIGARDLLRTNEPAFEELGLGDTSLDDAALIAAMVSRPRLIQRPIVIHGDRAVVARPPERALEVLD